MDKSKILETEKQNSIELPALIKHISSNEVAGFDNVEETIFLQPSDLQPISPSAKVSVSSTLSSCRPQKLCIYYIYKSILIDIM